MYDELFDSPDPLVRFNAHQAAKGRTQLADPDVARKRDKENPWPTTENLLRLSLFLERIRAAHKEHLRTGDYTALGIAAQDALREYEGSE